MGRKQSPLENMEIMFWRNKRVFLTGHTGFKGGWLAHWLNILGADICGFALAPDTQPNFFDLTRLEKNIKHLVGDIRDYDLLKKSIMDFKPDIIVHMAAQPLVIRSYANPLETFSTNIMGTANLLEAARLSQSTQVVLVITTDKCYENNNAQQPFCEGDRLGGHDPYSNSKACAELVTQSFRVSFYEKQNIGLATARAGNVIGGGDWSEHRLIPDMIRAIADKKKLTLRYPDAIRPWQHVLESLSGYLRLIEKCFSKPKKYSAAWNFGPKDLQHYSVKSIVEKFHEKINRDFNVEITENPKNEKLIESQHLTLNINKSLSELNWSPYYTTEQSIEKTAEWYNAWFNHRDMAAITRDQILDYQNKLSREKL